MITTTIRLGLVHRARKVEGNVKPKTWVSSVAPDETTVVDKSTVIVGAITVDCHGCKSWEECDNNVERCSNDKEKKSYCY
jgi:hypothetical protein